MAAICTGVGLESKVFLLLQPAMWHQVTGVSMVLRCVVRAWLSSFSIMNQAASMLGIAQSTWTREDAVLVEFILLTRFSVSKRSLNDYLLRCMVPLYGSRYLNTVCKHMHMTSGERF